jgi:hypothetical protein
MKLYNSNGKVNTRDFVVNNLSWDNYCNGVLKVFNEVAKV